MSKYECKHHGILTISNAWVTKDNIVICGKCASGENVVICDSLDLGIDQTENLEK